VYAGGLLRRWNVVLESAVAVVSNPRQLVNEYTYPVKGPTGE